MKNKQNQQVSILFTQSDLQVLKDLLRTEQSYLNETSLDLKVLKGAFWEKSVPGTLEGATYFNSFSKVAQELQKVKTRRNKLQQIQIKVRKQLAYRMFEY